MVNNDYGHNLNLPFQNCHKATQLNFVFENGAEKKSFKKILPLKKFHNIEKFPYSVWCTHAKFRVTQTKNKKVSLELNLENWRENEPLKTESQS